MANVLMNGEHMFVFHEIIEIWYNMTSTDKQIFYHGTFTNGNTNQFGEICECEEAHIDCFIRIIPNFCFKYFMDEA